MTVYFWRGAVCLISVVRDLGSCHAETPISRVARAQGFCAPGHRFEFRRGLAGAGRKAVASKIS